MTSKTEAIIYCRVNGPTIRGRKGSIRSQETKCRAYARRQGYRVTEVFSDVCSGARRNRPGMTAMLKQLRARRGEQCVVIVEDISRLARDLQVHMKLRAAIASAGGRLESLAMEFADDPDPRLVENLLASVAQWHDQKFHP